MQTIGLLFEQRSDLMADPHAQEDTHYHWREPEEVEAVATHLQELGYTVDQIGSLANLLDRWRQQKLPDFVWNLSVRAQSRNRTALAPALLEQLELPYTGGDAAVKSLTLNKDWLKPLVQWCGVKTPAWLCYGSGAAIDTLPPWNVSILKPTCEGYSLGLTSFESHQGLLTLQSLVAQLQQQFHSAVLCEEMIVGREVTVGIVGNGGVAPVFMGAIETVTLDGSPIGDRVLDLTAKRKGGFKKQVVDLNDSELKPLQTVVHQLNQVLQPLDYATFDFRIATDRQAYLLDINADATLHPQRSFAQIAYAAGLSYGELIQIILNTSLKRWHLDP